HGLVRVMPPPPQLSIRWSAAVDVDTRHRVEQQYGLHERERKDQETFQYFIDDASPGRLRSLLNESSVADTTGIDRQRAELVNSSFWSRTRADVPLLRLTPSIFPTREDASGWIYYVFLLSPPAALLVLFLSRRRPPDTLRVLSLSILCFELHQF